MANRDGKRKSREELRKRRTPLLGYYLIATDAKETEVNYLIGLRDSIPEEHKSKITIRVIDKVKPTELVKTVLEKASEHAQYAEPWIVFDRDSHLLFYTIFQTVLRFKFVSFMHRSGLLKEL